MPLYSFRCVLYALTIILLFGFLGNSVQAKEGYCQKGITLQKIKRLSGQGIGEGKFELTVKASIPSRNVSASTAQLKLGKGRIRQPDLHVGSLWVPLDGGSYNQTILTEATEHEVGADKFVGDTDYGDATSTIQVKCGTTNTIEQTVKIQGRQTGKIRVTYIVGPLEREYAKQGLRPSGSNGQIITHEKNVNRGGKDYRNFKLASANPGLCAQQCAEENRCKAFTYVPPGHQGNKARCWLKDQVPSKSSKKGLVSGVKRNVEQHTVVIDGSVASGGTGYTIKVDGNIEQVKGKLEGKRVTIQSNDKVRGDTATGRVGAGIDGYNVTGNIRSISLNKPNAAKVLVDGHKR